MLIQRDRMVKQEQLRDMQREADRERLARAARAGRPVVRIDVGLLSRIGRLVELIHLVHSRLQPIVRAEETTAR